MNKRSLIIVFVLITPLIILLWCNNRQVVVGNETDQDTELITWNVINKVLFFKKIKKELFRVKFDVLNKEWSIEEELDDFNQIKNGHNCYRNNDCWYEWWWGCMVCDDIEGYTFTYEIPNYWLKIKQDLWDLNNPIDWKTAIAYSGRWDAFYISGNNIYDIHPFNIIFYPKNKNKKDFLNNSDICNIYNSHIELYPNYSQLPLDKWIASYDKGAINLSDEFDCWTVNIIWNNITCYYGDYLIKNNKETIPVYVIYNRNTFNNFIYFLWESRDRSFWKIEVKDV